MAPLATYNESVIPPTAAWLGMTLIDYAPEDRSARYAFAPRPEMRNFGGVTQGGLLAAMMDDAMGALTFHIVGGTHAPASIDLATHFFHAVPLERIEVTAHVIRFGKAIAFAEAKLHRADGELSAQATSSMKLRPFTGLQFDPEEAA